MQVWIYFLPGVGGDGIANLLEKSQTVVTVDSNPPDWRLHRYVDGELKFWAPAIDRLHCFRRDRAFTLSNNALSQRYVELVKSKQNIVVTSHDIFLKNLNQSDEKHILELDQIKVLITTQNPKQAMITNLKKTLDLSTQEKLNQAYDQYLNWYKNINHANFDIVISSEDIQKNSDAIFNLCDKLSWKLNQHHYASYIDLITGKTKNLEIDQYQTTITHTGSIAYVKVPNNSIMDKYHTQRNPAFYADD